MKPKDIFVAHPEASKAVKQTESLVQIAQEPLLHITSFFPFQLFPDELIINPLEVLFIDNMFFRVSYETSMPIGDIGDVILTHGPFFATLTITPTSTLAKDEPIHISWLTRTNAQKAHDLLQGLVRVSQEHIDIAALLEGKNAKSEIIKLGQQL